MTGKSMTRIGLRLFAGCSLALTTAGGGPLLA